MLHISSWEGTGQKYLKGMDVVSLQKQGTYNILSRDTVKDSEAASAPLV